MSQMEVMDVHVTYSGKGWRIIFEGVEFSFNLGTKNHDTTRKEFRDNAIGAAMLLRMIFHSVSEEAWVELQTGLLRIARNWDVPIPRQNNKDCPIIYANFTAKRIDDLEDNYTIEDEENE